MPVWDYVGLFNLGGQTHSLCVAPFQRQEKSYRGETKLNVSVHAFLALRPDYKCDMLPLLKLPATVDCYLELQAKINHFSLKVL